MLEAHVLGQPHDELPAGVDGLAVPGALAAVGHAVADGEVGHGGVDLVHDAGARVAEHGVLGELGPHLGRRASRAGALERVVQRAEVRGIVGQGLEDALRVDARRLGAAADQRVPGADQHVMGGHHGIRHLVDDDVLETAAQHLLHGWAS